jgi:AAT family amino acid transporter
MDKKSSKEITMEENGKNYLEERKLVKRWNGPIPAIVSLLLTLTVFYITWWIFQDPRGWLRMYTPM